MSDRRISLAPPQSPREAVDSALSDFTRQKRSLDKRSQVSSSLAVLFGILGVSCLAWFAYNWFIGVMTLDDFAKVSGLWSGLLAFASFVFVYSSFVGQQKQNAKIAFDIAKAQLEVDNLQKQQRLNSLSAIANLYWKIVEGLRWTAGEAGRFDAGIRDLAGRQLLSVLGQKAMDDGAQSVRARAANTLSSYCTYLQVVGAELTKCDAQEEKEFFIRMMKAQMMREEDAFWDEICLRQEP